MSMDVSMKMLKFYADKYRGHSKTGPHWPAVIRIPYMYDEIVRLKQENERINKMDGLIEGRIVHYVMQNGYHRPAIVVRAWHNDKLELTEEGLCNLIVFVDGSNDVKRSIDDPLAKEPVLTMWETSRHYSKEPEPFTWHWIEKA